jgi:hypothetical protein
VAFNKAVVGARNSSTLWMPRTLKDKSLDLDDRVAWPWLPLVSDMEALRKRELQGIVRGKMQKASHVVGASFALASTLMSDCTANISAATAKKTVFKTLRN